MKILIINGPNLNLLGSRKPEVYGAQTLYQINRKLQEYFPQHELTFFQSNHEGEIVDQIQRSVNGFEAIIINPGALTHYSYSLRDAIEACPIPVVEVHLSNIAARESFRRVSVISEVCLGTISGFGWIGYLLAVEGLMQRNKK